MFDDAFKAWAIRGPLSDVARQVMTDAKQVHVLLRPDLRQGTGRDQATPWHQDLPFLPIRGEQMVRIWVPFDRVTADSGAIHYLRGSHRWGVDLPSGGLQGHPHDHRHLRQLAVRDMPDFEADYGSYEWLVAEAEPGDLLLHHPLTVHGSLGNLTGDYPACDRQLLRR